MRHDPYPLLCIHKSPNQADTYPAVCVKRATLLSDVNGDLTESHNAGITCEALDVKRLGIRAGEMKRNTTFAYWIEGRRNMGRSEGVAAEETVPCSSLARRPHFFFASLAQPVCLA